MLRTILVISLAALSLNAFAECKRAEEKVEIFTKAKASRTHDYRRDEASDLAKEVATKKALQECVMKGAKNCGVISSLTLCETKTNYIGSDDYRGTCTVVVRGYKATKNKADDDFSTLCD